MLVSNKRHSAFFPSEVQRTSNINCNILYFISFHTYHACNQVDQWAELPDTDWFRQFFLVPPQTAVKRDEIPFSAGVSHFWLISVHVLIFVPYAHFRSIFSLFLKILIFGHEFWLISCQVSGNNQNNSISPFSLVWEHTICFYRMAVVLKAYGASPGPKVGFGTLARNPALDSCEAEVNTCSNH